MWSQFGPMDRDLEDHLWEWKHIITLVKDDDNCSKNNKQMSITQYVRDRELGLRGIRKQRFIRQAEITVYDDGYEDWPDNVQRKIFREIRKNYESPSSYGDVKQVVFNQFGATRRITRFIESPNNWIHQCIRRHARWSPYYRPAQDNYTDYNWVEECVSCNNKPLVHIRIPTGVNDMYIELILFEDFIHNIKYDDFQKLAKGNHHQLLLDVIRGCTTCGYDFKCKCQPEVFSLRPLRPLPPPTPPTPSPTPLLPPTSPPSREDFNFDDILEICKYLFIFKIKFY